MVKSSISIDFLALHKFIEFLAIYGRRFFTVGLDTWTGSGLMPSIYKILEISEVEE